MCGELSKYYKNVLISGTYPSKKCENCYLQLCVNALRIDGGQRSMYDVSQEGGRQRKQDLYNIVLVLNPF